MKEGKVMNLNLNNVAFEIGKVEALMHIIEETCLDIGITPQNKEVVERATSMFYVLWDELRNIEKAFEVVCDDAKAVDAIYAVNAVRKNDIREAK